MAPTTRSRKSGGASSSSRPRKGDSTPDSQRARYEARQERTRARTAAGKPRRSEDATSIPEALDIEREQGRREGLAQGVRRPRGAPPVKRTGKYRTKAYGGSEANPAPRSAPVRVQAPNLGPAPGVTAPMLVDLAIIAADSIVHEKHPPTPSRLLVVFTLFGLLGLVGRSGPEAGRLSSAIGWSVVLATFYNTARPKEAPLGITALGSLGDFLSGKYANGPGPTGPGTSGQPGKRIKLKPITGGAGGGGEKKFK